MVRMLIITWDCKNQTISQACLCHFQMDLISVWILISFCRISFNLFYKIKILQCFEHWGWDDTTFELNLQFCVPTAAPLPPPSPTQWVAWVRCRIVLKPRGNEFHWGRPGHQAGKTRSRSLSQEYFPINTFLYPTLLPYHLSLLTTTVTQGKKITGNWGWLFICF